MAIEHQFLQTSEIKQKIRPVAASYGIKRIYLFGSRAKGTAGENSDVDLLIEKGRSMTLLDLSGFRLDCMDQFGCDVDVITTEGIEEGFFNEIHGSEVLIYEA